MTAEKEPANGYTIKNEIKETFRKYKAKIDDTLLDEINLIIQNKVKIIKDGISIAISDYPEDINAVAPGIMEIINYNFSDISAHEEVMYGPECKICNKRHEITEFVSASWMQILYSVDGGEHGTIIWVCPDCISKEYNKKVN